MTTEKVGRRPATVGVRLVRRVGRATDRDPLDLPVLAERVDPEALNALASSGSRSLVVRFRYAGQIVTVRGDGRIELRSASETDAVPSE